MGASNSTLEEDKGLQLCRARKKFIKQALNGRCSLAAAHITYVEELKIIGTAIRRFAEPDEPNHTYPSRTTTPSLLEKSISKLSFSSRSLEKHVEPDEPNHTYPSRTTTPSLLEKSISKLSFSSRSLEKHVDPTEQASPSPSPSVSSRFHSHQMKFTTPFSKKVEEKPATPVTVSINSTTPPSTTPPSTTPRSTEIPEASSFETPEASTPPWDYFGLFHPIDDHLNSQDGRGSSHGSDEGMPELEDVEEKVSSSESEDEFAESPSLATLVRSFKNVNTSTENIFDGGSPKVLSENKEIYSSPISKKESEVKENVGKNDPPVQVSENVRSETKFVNGKKNGSPELSPLRATPSSRFAYDVKITPMKESEVEVEDKLAPKDFFSSMKEIERLFLKASDSGKEVPRMLEANKFHFRPVFPGKEGGLITSALLSSCFSCGQDPSEVQREPQQNSVKYLTWHRTTSSRSSSSRNLLNAANHAIDDVDDQSNNLFDNFCMVSGSHASTLDRLYAWEKKLYDEVKAGQVLRSNFDQKCKLLRQQESRAEHPDKTRAAVKDLHSRIIVAIHRIDSISKKIEEIRDKELQPQLEELIAGLRKMWEMMMECHKLQFHIISISHAPGGAKITIQSDTRRQITIHLGNELHSFTSGFTKWIEAQKLYLESINKWLMKCVSIPQNKTKRNKRAKPPPIERLGGPPIYMICGAWLEMIEKLPSKEVIDSVKDLTAEVSHFLPHQEKKSGKHEDILKDEASVDWIPAMDRFRVSLTGFLGQLSNFAEDSVNKFTELQKAIEAAKSNYEQFKFPQQNGV